MSRKNRIINIFCILLILYFPLSELIVGFDTSDIGFILNQYEFVFSDINTIYLPLLLTDILGHSFLKIIRFFGLPEYLCFEILWALSCYYLCFLSSRLYKKYCNNILIMPALVFAVILAKTNLNFFMYNTSVAIFSLTGLYFFIIAVNDKKEHYLSLSVLMMCLSTLCKASAIIQFCMYIVLFFDLHKKRDIKYFIKQVGFCAAGFLIGILVCGTIVHYSCGIKQYLDMLLELFVYAGNSNDGHTISNMVIINVKGTLHGIVWLTAAFVIYCICNFRALKKYQTIVGRTMAVIAIIFILGKFAGFDNIKGFDLLYSTLWKYFEALSVVVVMMYISAFGIIKDKTVTYQYKVLVLASAILLFCMPIGSNVGIPHLCNELFIAMPFIFIFVRERLLSSSTINERNIKLYLSMAFIIWISVLSFNQAFYRSNYIKDKNIALTYTDIEELRYIKCENDLADNLGELLDYLSQHEEYESLTEVGYMPIINYLSKIKPGVNNCGGWIETDYVSASDIKNDLYENKPVIVICNDVFGEDTEKNSTIKEFLTEEEYSLSFKNDMFSLYYYK